MIRKCLQSNQQFLFVSQAVESKLVMDDINVEANPDYLDISANIDKSGAEPVANVEIDLKKDVSTIKAKVSLSAEMGGVFKDIFVAKEFSPCDDDVEDEFVKYAL